jgi:hypothetical protein
MILRPPGLTDLQWPIARKALVNKCLAVRLECLAMSSHSVPQCILFVRECVQVLLEPLKLYSMRGVTLKDPWGVQQLVVPMLAEYCADCPEQSDCTCTANGERTNYPCHRCMVRVWPVHPPACLPACQPASARAARVPPLPGA